MSTLLENGTMVASIVNKAFEDGCLTNDEIGFIRLKRAHCIERCEIQPTNSNLVSWMA